MAFHHVAIATRDLAATHAFYTDVMGFELVNVEAAPTPEGGGWARHAFYDTGGGECLAIWDIHDDPAIPADFDPSISRGLGLPTWTNHIAFAATDLDALDAQQDRWRSHGYDVLRIDHGWCTSIYVDDPNGIAIEFCCTTRHFTDDDHAEAQRRLTASRPPMGDPPVLEVLDAIRTPVGTS
jgi:catechol 2,3-dioxygenase-like lactoylglutathione lyase family enzyme